MGDRFMSHKVKSRSLEALFFWKEENARIDDDLLFLLRVAVWYHPQNEENPALLQQSPLRGEGAHKSCSLGGWLAVITANIMRPNSGEVHKTASVNTVKSWERLAKAKCVCGGGLSQSGMAIPPPGKEQLFCLQGKRFSQGGYKGFVALQLWRVWSQPASTCKQLLQLKKLA